MMYSGLIVIGALIVRTQVIVNIWNIPIHESVLKQIYVFLQALKGQDFPIPTEELYENYK